MHRNNSSQTNSPLDYEKSQTGPAHTSTGHDKYTLVYALSRLFERAGYYGIRGMIVLYMISETMGMDDQTAISVYGYFTAYTIIAHLLGAALGDLLIGNKRGLIIGGLLQAIGAFVLCIPSLTGLYAGMVLIVTGGGLYSPNLFATFGKHYLNKTNLLDAGFGILYLAINMGAFFGTVALGVISEEVGFRVGFVLGGILLLLAVVLLAFVKDRMKPANPPFTISAGNRTFKILLACFVVGAFWGVYEMSYYGIYEIQRQVGETLNISDSLSQSLGTVYLLPLLILAIVLWSIFRSGHFIKMLIGFVSGAIGLALLLMIFSSENTDNSLLFLVSMFFMSIAEIHIAPIGFSILTRYGNPKYLALILSLIVVVSGIFYKIVGLLAESLYEQPSLITLIGMTTMTLISIGLLIYLVMVRKR